MGSAKFGTAHLSNPPADPPIEEPASPWDFIVYNYRSMRRRPDRWPAKSLPPASRGRSRCQMSNSEMLVRLIGAAVLGSMIGFERERLLWAAGIRTHMLVCVGSCLIMIVSQYGFSNILTYEHVVLDPSRIAAQVVSGIGFLGAGAILARGEIVKGLTTAASIWTVAAIGLAVGGGLYLAAGASTIIILLILAGIKPLEEAYRSRNQSCQLKVEVDNGSLTPDLLREALGLRAGQVKRFLVENRNPEGADELVILLSKVSSQDIASFPQKLKELDGVRDVTVMKRASE
jgi:putative Mg2+ transporter-C (MgtC) family protein